MSRSNQGQTNHEDSAYNNEYNTYFPDNSKFGAICLNDGLYSQDVNGSMALENVDLNLFNPKPDIGGRNHSTWSNENNQMAYNNTKYQDSNMSSINNYTGHNNPPNTESNQGSLFYNQHIVETNSYLQGMVPFKEIRNGQIMVPSQGTTFYKPPGEVAYGNGIFQKSIMGREHGLPPNIYSRHEPSYGQETNSGIIKEQVLYTGMPPTYSVPSGLSSGKGLMTSPATYDQTLKGQMTGTSASTRYGNPPSQNKSMKPDNFPNVIQVIDRDKYNDTYHTGSRDKVPPLVTTDFVAIDQGTSNPKFIRSTLYKIPTTQDLLKSLHIPFVLSITPFAKLDSLEQAILCGETGERGPVRCIRCKAYMSPLMTFIDGGRRFQCNLCRANTDVAEDYFVHLDQIGNRIDCYSRPELCLGSYEMIATKEYCRNDSLPNSPAFIFMIDVSYCSVKSGLVNVVCSNIKEFILPHLCTDPLVPNSGKPLVGFITYDRVLHFYNMKSTLTKPQMLVVSYFDDDKSHDLVPIVDGFLVDPDEAVDQINSLMESIVDTYSSNEERGVILGPVIEAGVEALKAAGNRSGKLFVFHSSLPSIEAPGKLKARDERTVIGTEKEQSQFACSSSYYTKLADDCVRAGVSVDLFLTPSAFIDVATLSQLPKTTGGNLFKYDYFSPCNHAKQLIIDLQHAVSAPCAFDAVMRIRTSLGLGVVEYYGNFFMDNTDDVHLACIDANKSVLVEIKHNDKLQENEAVYIQVAVLYTAVSGQRRLRIHNISMNISSNVMEIFKMADLDTLINWMTKHSIKVFLSKTLKDVRDEVCHQCAQILASYRRNNKDQNNLDDLVLPENLKLLPLYANSLLKCEFMQSGSNLAIDERNFVCFLLNSMDVRHSQAYFYPRLFTLKNLEDGSKALPVTIRDSYEKLSPDGVYLIENGVNMFLFIGKNVESSWLQETFNCNRGTEIIDRTELPLLDTDLSRTLNHIILTIRSSRYRYMKLSIVVQGEKMESTFRELLVEDHSDKGGLSYAEFLCKIHKDIRTLLNR